MSRPVWRIASTQLSSGMKWVPSPRSASDAALTDMCEKLLANTVIESYRIEMG